MREALRLLCLSFVGLVVAARVAAPMVVARKAEDVVSGSCEVLNFSTKSPQYDLPITLTVMPLDAGWRLDVTLRQTEGAAVCVRLEDKQTKLRVTALLGSCDEGKVTDYNSMNVTVPSGTWTSLRVDVKAKAVIVWATDGTNTSVGTHGPPLQRDGTQVELTRAVNVEAAVGCRTNCPGYRHASPGSEKKKTVKSWTAERGKFYFLPGSAFVRLEYEVGCTTTLGNKMFLHVEDITVDSQKPRWHMVLLEHHGGLATVSLDHLPLKNKTLPGGCTFSEHTIRVMGDGLFSFMCNPSSGGVEECRYVQGVEKVQAGTNFSSLSIGIITTLAIALAIALVAVGLMHLKKDRQRLKQNEQQQLEDYLLKELYPWCNKTEKRKEILQKLKKGRQEKEGASAKHKKEDSPGD